MFTQKSTYCLTLFIFNFLLLKAQFNQIIDINWWYSLHPSETELRYYEGSCQTFKSSEHIKFYKIKEFLY